MFKHFLTSISIGFMIGTAALVYYLGPSGVREQVCQGYVEDAKPLKLSREEKETYLVKYQKQMASKSEKDSLIEAAMAPKSKKESQSKKSKARLSKARKTVGQHLRSPSDKNS